MPAAFWGSRSAAVTEPGEAGRALPFLRGLIPGSCVGRGVRPPVPPAVLTGVPGGTGAYRWVVTERDRSDRRPFSRCSAPFTGRCFTGALGQQRLRSRSLPYVFVLTGKKVFQTWLCSGRVGRAACWSAGTAQRAVCNPANSRSPCSEPKLRLYAAVFSRSPGRAPLPSRTGCMRACVWDTPCSALPSGGAGHCGLGQGLPRP